MRRMTAASPPAPGSQPGANPSGVLRPGSAVALGSFLILAGSLVGLMTLDGDDSLFLLAPVQILLGSVGFLASITCIVVVFARLGIYDRSKALGLPEGSVRALIALILLIIFVIFANIVFGMLSGKEKVPHNFAGLTTQEITGLPGAVVERRPSAVTTPPPPSPTFDGVYLQDQRNEDGAALGQQIVTALITLVAAISAFYFGSGTVTAAARAMGGGGEDGVRGGGLFIRRPSSPAQITKTDEGFQPVTIEVGGASLADAGVRATIEGDDAGAIVSANGTDVFTYTPVNPVAPVTVTFTAMDGSDVSAKVSFTVPTEP